MRSTLARTILSLCFVMTALAFPGPFRGPIATAGVGWIINEVLYDPAAADGDGNVDVSQDEFIEFVNLGGAEADISGWTITDGCCLRHTFPPATVVPDSCAVVVFGGGSAGLAFNGALFQIASTGLLGLNNGGDDITLANEFGEVIAIMSYPGTGNADQSLVLDPDLSVDQIYVKHIDASTSGGAAFSPGTLSDGMSFGGCPDEPPVPGDTGWVINEILADPDGDTGDANGDGVVDTGQDEFVEIYNDTGEAADISGWSVSDGVQVRHVIPNGTVLNKACALVVFGGGVIGLEFNGATMQRASNGFLGLNNGGDTITLANAGGVPQAVATYGAEGGNNESLNLEPDITGESYLRHPAAAGAVGAYSPGTGVDGASFGGCPDEPPLVIVNEIWELQGSDLTSPFDGQTVITQNNVVTAVANNGFFMQTPDERIDGDPETSDGIFVFTSGAPGVNIGDMVDVTAEVQEFYDLTELAFPDLVIATSPGNPVPDPIIFDDDTPSPDQPQPINELERYEGMLVEFTGGIVTGAYNRYGELLVVATGERAFREPGVPYPGLPEFDVWDGNPEIFEVVPDFLGLPDQRLPAGASIDRCVGPLTYNFGAYTVAPLVLETTGAASTRPVRARQGTAEFTVATLNLFSLYDDNDDPGNDTVLGAGEYQRRLTKHSLYIRQVLGSPDVLAVQEVESLKVLQELANEIFGDDDSVLYTPELDVGQDSGLRNIGFLVRNTMTDVTVTQLGLGAIFGDGTPTFSRPPLVFEGSYNGGPEPFPITVMNLHLRSRRNIDNFDDDGDFARARRFAQAMWVAEEVQTRQVANANVRLVVTGDFNSYEFTDGQVDVLGIIAGTAVTAEAQLETTDIVEPNLTNQVLSLPVTERYSAEFEGSANALDHALTSATLAEFVRGVEYGRGNTDAPFSFLDDSATPLRASDHDGLVLFLSGGSDEPIFHRGDSNLDGNFDISDASYSLNFLFLGGPSASCPDAADANDDGNFDISDASYALNFLFLGGPAPPAPGQVTCGPDPTDDMLPECVNDDDGIEECP